MKTAEEILNENVFIDGISIMSNTKSTYESIIKTMEQYAEQEEKKEKEEFREWLINEDYEGLAERY